MKKFAIDIDEKVWHYLQQHAEPFVDTPNSVLNRLLFGEEAKKKAPESIFSIPSANVEGLPKVLSQILEVVYEVEVNGYSRIQATNRVAKKQGTAPQTITNKYCRRLGKKAHEIDVFLNESGYKSFKELLKSKFSNHAGIIDMYFDSMMSDGEDALNSAA
jgi:hypothetical protein